MDQAWVQHVTSILEYLERHVQTCDAQVLQSARDLMESLDAWSFIGSGSNYSLQIRAVEIIQRIAYYDVDRGAVSDIGNWALNHWLRILQRHPRSVPALKGVGSWWLSRAQPSLARVHTIDGSSSGSEGSRARSSGELAQEQANEAEQAQAEARVHSAEYVEARGILQPSTDYMRRAVEEAASQGLITGQLLIVAAESYMSLGNVSSARDGERLFRQAILYLRQASNIPGYPLPAHLQRWLEDYGRFVD